jgi:thiamine transporter
MFKILTADVFNAPSGIFNEAGSAAWYYAITAIAIALCFAIVFFVSRKDKTSKEGKTKEIAFAGICIALSTVLSMMKIFEMPQGGSITPASLLPIALFSYMYGARNGVLICFAYGMLQALIGGYIVHPIQFLLDYPIAFACVGLTGIFKKFDMKYGFVLGFLVAVMLRFMVHGFGGMVFFASYAPGPSFGELFIYSFGYNSFCLVDGAIVMVLGYAMLSSKSIVHLVKSAMPMPVDNCIPQATIFDAASTSNSSADKQ